MKSKLPLSFFIDLGVTAGFLLSAILLAIKKPDRIFLVPVYAAIGALWYHNFVLPVIRKEEFEGIDLETFLNSTSKKED